MAVGKVKWFNNAKGFGFIVPEDGGEDIFAHYSTIQMDGYRSLKAGQEVTFDVQQGPKGLHAENIGVVEEPEHISVDAITHADRGHLGNGGQFSKGIHRFVHHRLGKGATIASSIAIGLIALIAWGRK